MKCFCVFLAGGLLFGAAALGIGQAVDGADALLQGGTAFGLAFLPAAATLAGVLRSYRANPEMQLLACLGGSGARMAVALGGGMFLTSSHPETFNMAFWYWLLCFYLGLLGFEITLVVRQQPTLAVPVQRTTV